MIHHAEKASSSTPLVTWVSQVTDFEYNDELSVFDMLGINLLHGWLYDPQDATTSAAIKGLSYNQANRCVDASCSFNDNHLTYVLAADHNSGRSRRSTVALQTTIRCGGSVEK